MIKLATLTFFFLFTQAFAGTCDDLESIYLSEDSVIEPFKVSETHGKFSSLEQRMIKVAVESDGYYKNLTMKEALELFADKSEWREIGYNAGTISYTKFKGKVFAKVVYYPGDNEYGAIFEVRAQSFHKLTAINDGDLVCGW